MAEKRTAAARPTLESSMEALEKVMEQLEREEVTLEESFRLYKDGMKLLKECNAAIDKVEKKIIVLNGDETNGF